VSASYMGTSHRQATVRFTTWARVKDDMRDYSVIRKVQRAVRFSLQTAGVFSPWTAITPGAR